MTSAAEAPNVKHIVTKYLPESIRPRERLAAIGAPRLSNSELIAIVIGTGGRGVTSLQMAEKLMGTFGGVGKLGASDFHDLAAVSGIGPAKAAQLIAAIELGKRAGSETASSKKPLSSPQKVAEMLMPMMRYLEIEHFKALIVNNKNQLIKSVDVAVGSLSAAIIHPRELYKTAIRANGAGLIVAHNHPSGDVTPSREDIVLTRRLAEAGRILGIDFIDHIIIGDGCWLSLKEQGCL
ncbi:MAG: DNA repair protein RadC [Actinomycetota bacterium]|nr:DNA repair protein RadC [Actinomycetota bacterium]